MRNCIKQNDYRYNLQVPGRISSKVYIILFIGSNSDAVLVVEFGMQSLHFAFANHVKTFYFMYERCK